MLSHRHPNLYVAAISKYNADDEEDDNIINTLKSKMVTVFDTVLQKQAVIQIKLQMDHGSTTKSVVIEIVSEAL